MEEHGRQADGAETLHVSVEYVSRAWAAQALKRELGHPQELDMFQWVVSFKVLVLRLMFRGTQFPIDENESWVVIETQHVPVSVCSRALAAHARKPTPGCLKASDSFMTCH